MVYCPPLTPLHNRRATGLWLLRLTGIFWSLWHCASLCSRNDKWAFLSVLVLELFYCTFWQTLHPLYISDKDEVIKLVSDGLFWVKKRPPLNQNIMSKMVMDRDCQYVVRCQILYLSRYYELWVSGQQFSWLVVMPRPLGPSVYCGIQLIGRVC